jgi:uncharacterized protein
MMKNVYALTSGFIAEYIPGQSSCLFFVSTVAFIVLIHHWSRHKVDVKATITHGKSSVRIQRKGGETTTFSEICRTYCSTSWPAQRLFNGHLHSIWNVTGSAEKSIFYKRRIFEHEDPRYPGTFAVDFVTALQQAADARLPPRTATFEDEAFANFTSADTKPMLVVLHGLSGGSHEGYVRDTLMEFMSAKGSWEACVVISRGCGRTRLSSSILFNGKSSWDLRQTVSWIRERFPNRPLYGIGFSLGANIFMHVSSL